MGKGYTPYQGFYRKYGHFKCEDCGRFWQSGNSWADCYQCCKGCREPVYPYLQENLQKPTDDKTDPNKAHEQELCEKCRELGRLCVGLEDDDEDYTQYGTQKIKRPEERNIYCSPSPYEPPRTYNQETYRPRGYRQRSPTPSSHSEDYYSDDEKDFFGYDYKSDKFEDLHRRREPSPRYVPRYQATRKVYIVRRR